MADRASSSRMSFGSLGDNDPDACPPDACPPDEPPLPRLFPGQRRSLDAIMAMCKPGGSVVITGSIGVGKTRVAREAADWLQSVHPDLQIVQINANAWTDFEGGFCQFEKRAGLETWAAPQYLRQDPYRESGQRQRLAQRGSNLERFRAWFRDEKKMWCVIVDRADDEEILFGRRDGGSLDEGGLIGNLPKGGNVFFLFTTRSSKIADGLVERSVGVVGVGPLTETDAVSLLQEQAGPPFDAQTASQLVKTLEFNPLAIMERENILRDAPWATDAQVLDNLTAAKQSMPPNLDPGLRAVLLALSVESPSAMELLNMLSFFHYRDIPLCLLASLTNESDLTPATDKDKELQALSQLHLITRSYSYCDRPFGHEILQRGLELLPTVQAAVQAWLEERGELEHRRVLFLARLARAFEPSSKDFQDVDAEFRHQRLIPHGRAAFWHFPKDKMAQADWAFVVYGTGRYVQKKGQPVEDMIDMMKKLAFVQESNLGMAHEVTLACLHLLALLHRGNDAADEELAVFRQIVLTRQFVLDQDRVPVGKDAEELREILAKGGRSSDVDWLLDKALAQLEKMFEEPRRPPLAAGKGEQLSVKLSDTVDMIEQLIDLLDQRSVEPDSETLTRRIRLAMLLLKHGVLRRAERHFRQSISISEKSGADEPLMLAANAGLVSTLVKQGRWWKAQDLSVSVMKARKQTLGEDHPDTLAIRADHASTFLKQEQWDEAEELINGVIEARQRVLGKEHRNTLESMSELGVLYAKLERWEEAESILTTVVDARDRVLGGSDPDTLESVTRLAAVYAHQSDWEEVEAMIKRVTESTSWQRGNVYPDTLDGIVTLAPLLRGEARRRFAVSTLTNCIEVQELAFDQDHPALATSRYFLSKWKKEDLQLEEQEPAKDDDWPAGVEDVEMSVFRSDRSFSTEFSKQPGPSLWQRLMRFCSPPDSGFERIFFTCGCGELLSMDVRELRDGGIERLRHRLEESAAAIRTRTGTAGSSSRKGDGGGPTQPPAAHLGGSAAGSSSTSGGPSDGAGGAQPPSQGQTPNKPSDRTATRLQQTARVPQYLLLCVKSELMVLAQISVAALTNDEYLFKRVREEYEAVRSESGWHISIPFPEWLSEPWHRFVAWLPEFPRLAAAFGPLKRAWGRHLHQVSTGDFVQFSLVPVRMRLCPSGLKTKQLPPEEEVQGQRYLYSPVPIEVEYADIPLGHLMKPGRHFDNFWLTTFPKKLKGPLVRRAGGGAAEQGACVGWGIRVNEGLDKRYVLWTVHKVLVLIMVVTVLYGYFKADWGDSFGLGSLLVGILAIWLPFQYLAWSEETAGRSGSGSNE